MTNNEQDTDNRVSDEELKAIIQGSYCGFMKNELVWVYSALKELQHLRAQDDSKAVDVEGLAKAVFAITNASTAIDDIYPIEKISELIRAHLSTPPNQPDNKPVDGTKHPEYYKGYMHGFLNGEQLGIRKANTPDAQQGVDADIRDLVWWAEYKIKVLEGKERCPFEDGDLNFYKILIEQVLPQPQPEVSGVVDVDWDKMERDCLMTFHAGISDSDELKAFQGGMRTVFSLLRDEFPHPTNTENDTSNNEQDGVK